MHTCESWHIPTHLESQVNICEDSHHLDATGAEVMGSLVFSRDADPCKNNGVARIFTKSSGKGIAETVQTMILYETRPDEPGGCRPLRLIDKRTEAMLWCSKSYIIDLLQPKLQPCLEQERACLCQQCCCFLPQVHFWWGARRGRNKCRRPGFESTQIVEGKIYLLCQ